LRGKVDSQARDPVPDRERDLPSHRSAGQATTAVALKLDKARHTIESLREVAPAVQEAQGNCDVFVQVETGAQKSS